MIPCTVTTVHLKQGTGILRFIAVPRLCGGTASQGVHQSAALTLSQGGDTKVLPSPFPHPLPIFISPTQHNTRF